MLHRNAPTGRGRDRVDLGHGKPTHGPVLARRLTLRKPTIFALLRRSSAWVESRMGAVAWGQWPTPRFPFHRVTGGGRPPPVPTEPGVQISGTGLFGSRFTAPRGLAAPGVGDAAWVAATASSF